MTTSLTYFDFDGSRGLECRLALTVAGVDFEDLRVKREQWAGLKPTLPYGALPLLTVDGQRLAHSSVILGYVGRNHGMHPSTPWDAARHDALMVSVEDLRTKVPGGRGLSDEEKQQAREDFATGWLTRWATTVAGEIKGPFLEGDVLHVADIKLYVILRAYLTEGYDHIPAALFDAWPELTTLYEAVDAHPTVKAYWQDR